MKFLKKSNLQRDVHGASKALKFRSFYTFVPHIYSQIIIYLFFCVCFSFMHLLSRIITISEHNCIHNVFDILNCIFAGNTLIAEDVEHYTDLENFQVNFYYRDIVFFRIIEFFCDFL